MGASEEFFQKMLVQMAQQNQQNKWSSPSNILSAGQLLLSGLGGLSQGAAASAASQSAAEQLAYQQAQDAYLRRLQGRTGLQNAIMGQLDRRDQAGVNIANASPLGAEQLFRQQMAGARAASAMAENFQPLMPGASSSLTPYVARTPNVVSAYASPDYRSTISSGATEDSIRDRRAVIDGLRADRPDALSRENQLMQLLVAQMQEASKPLYQADPTGQQAQAAPKKERGFWSKLGSVALPVAGLAAGFIPGVGPLAGAALAGAGSALGRAAGGGGVKDAILAGAGGAAAGYGMAKAGIGEPGGLLSRAPKAGFEGPNLALDKFGAMMPGGQSAASMAMPDLPSAAPALFARPNMTPVAYPSSATQPRIAPSAGRVGLPPMRPAASHVIGAASAQPVSTSTLGANRPTAMRASTGVERFRDFISPVADALGGIGAPGMGFVSTTQPYSASPLAAGQPSAFGQVSQSPIGAAILGTVAGAAPRSAGQLMRPGASPSTQAMASQILQAANAKLKAGDVAGAQALWAQLQPLMPFLPR